MSTGRIGKMPIGYMVRENIGKKGPPMIRSDDFFLAYSLSIQWRLKGGDRQK